MKREKKKSEKIQKYHLDIGCGDNKQVGFIGMDKRPLACVDIVHDIEAFPWPLENESCAIINCSHVIEHIDPKYQIDFMNECWRVLEDGGLLAISTPYGGSERWHQDPTHCASWTRDTIFYFSVIDEGGNPVPDDLYRVYRPKPWQIAQFRYIKNLDINVLFRKVVKNEK